MFSSPVSMLSVSVGKVRSSILQSSQYAALLVWGVQDPYFALFSVCCSVSVGTSGFMFSSPVSMLQC
jgi:hypothetical protein